MYTNSGYLYHSKAPFGDNSIPLIVSSCGTCRLCQKDKFVTLRPDGRPDYQVTEISAIVGYDNPLYFSRIFRKQKGMSPSAFRK